MKFKNRVQLISVLFLLLLTVACERSILDKRIDIDLTPDQVFVNYDRMKDFGNGVYTYVPEGYNRIDGSLLAGATDDAEHTDFASNVQQYNLGTWNQYSNPDDQWGNYYQGIRRATIFLDGSLGYKQILVKDTLTLKGKEDYADAVSDIAWLRGEVRFLRAYFYFELAKRYGGVPIVKTVAGMDDENNAIPRADFNEVIRYIVDECDAVTDSVRVEWHGFRDDEVGRVDKGTVLALKSRALLYAASPLFNTSEDVTKWEAAAKAAADVILMNKYKLEINYRNLFIAPLSYRSNEVIFSRREGNQNFMEKENYPIGTEGGQSGTTPSQNLVDAYEQLPGWDPANPYENRDPRLNMTVVVNNSSWNGRTMEIWEGGKDGKGKSMSTRTGYYLKKFLGTEVDITHNVKTIYAWILFRYAEILLNYAEAMNEAYGPDADPKGYGITARDAINQIRSRPGVTMPPVDAGSRDEMRDKIKRERRVELAFEEHRFWDLRRWKDPSLNSPLMGVSIVRNTDLSFTYTPVKVEDRVFEQKMNLYPIPQSEVDRSNGLIPQNPDWQ